MITQYKWRRLKKHLVELEKWTGGRLRTTARESPICCSLGNFAPDEVHGGYDYPSIGCGMIYHDGTSFKPYTKEDSDWWYSLSIDDSVETTKRVEEWIANRPAPLGGEGR